MSATGTALGDLDPHRRRVLVRSTVARSTLTVIAVLAGYFVLPFTSDSVTTIVVRTTIGVMVIIVIVAAQLRSIVHADYPELRTIEGFALAVPLLLTVFAAAFLALSQVDADAFSEQLDHIGALYLTVMTITTIGFGDVVPVSAFARVLVMLQIVANVALIAVASKLAYAAIRKSQSRSDSNGGDNPRR